MESRRHGPFYLKDVRQRVAKRSWEVESASWASNMPLWARASEWIAGRRAASTVTDRQFHDPIVNTVDRSYFETAGVVIERGRELPDTGPVGLRSLLAIVNEKLAHDFWPGADALGKRIQVPGENEIRRIIGVSRTANYSSWAEPPQALRVSASGAAPLACHDVICAQQGRARAGPECGSVAARSAQRGRKCCSAAFGPGNES